MMNDKEKQDRVGYCLLALYPGYFHAGEEKKKEYMNKLFEEIHELGLEELCARISFMNAHGEK